MSRSYPVTADSAEGLLADLGDTGEVVWYLVGFWAFLLSPKYRTTALAKWRQAGTGTRSLMIIDGVVATIVGLGLPTLIVWLLTH